MSGPENTPNAPEARAGHTLVSFATSRKRDRDGLKTVRNPDGTTVPITENAEIPAFIRNLMGPEKSFYIPLNYEKTIQLISTLNEINGQGAYSNESQALGRLTTSEYLILPDDQNITIIAAKDVGSKEAKAHFAPKYIMAVYALNKAIGGSGDEAIRFGMARAEAVKMGWYCNQREVRMAPTPQDFLDTIEADAEAMIKCAEDAALAAWIVPMCTEHTFRTQGHNYITGLSAAYSARCSSLLNACLAGTVDKFMSDDNLYHKAFHWISPSRVWEVLTTSTNDDLIPAALKIRINSPPAGTALVTTTKAIFDSMQARNLQQCIEKYEPADMRKVIAMDSDIRRDPPKWHKVPSAYNKPVLTPVDAQRLQDAKTEATKVAPICKAYVDVMLRDAPMARQKVLDKAAEANPVLYHAMKKYLQGYARIRPANVQGYARIRPANVDAVFITSGETANQEPRVEEAP